MYNGLTVRVGVIVGRAFFCEMGVDVPILGIPKCQYWAEAQYWNMWHNLGPIPLIIILPHDNCLS